jgi:hypothetical protein
MPITIAPRNYLVSHPAWTGRGSGELKMGIKKTAPVAFRKSGVATGTAPLAITAARFFGLDAGDWSMIFLGLALSALLLALA